MKRAWVVAAAFLVATASAQDKAQGIAGQVCAACHAPDGNSVAAANPKIAGQIAEYLQKQLRDFKAQSGKKPLRESAIMNGMVANLSDDDMKGLAAFYAGQAQKPAAAADKELAALGQKLWRGGDSTHGIPRAPVYTTVLNEDVPLKSHPAPELFANVRAVIERSSAR